MHPLKNNLYEILLKIPRDINNNHVFLYARKFKSYIRGGFLRTCEKSNIVFACKKSGFVYHDLLHLFDAYMRKASGAESVIMEIIGHATREMLDRYNMVDKDDS